MTANWPIRVRLSVWYSLMLLAGLTLFGGGIWLVVSHGLRASLDESLTAQAKGVTTVIQSEFDEAHQQQLREELAEYAAATPEGNLIDIQDPQGQSIVSSKAMTLDRSGAAPQGGFAVQANGSRRYRTLTTTAAVAGQTYRILVATPL